MAGSKRSGKIYRRGLQVSASKRGTKGAVRVASPPAAVSAVSAAALSPATVASTASNEDVAERNAAPTFEPPTEAETPPAVALWDRVGSAAGWAERGQAYAQHLWQRIRGLSVEQWAWIAVLTVGAVLRFWGLGDKALHHDESMHAYYSLLFAQDPASYMYDPILHGPFQFHAEGLMFAFILGLQHIFAAGAVGNPWINDTTARFVPALFGIGIVALPLGLRRELGRVGALIAAFLLAVSPAFVYFSRFLREDIYFNFFMFAMVVAALQFARKRTARWFIALFVATILAYATFEGIFLTLAIFGAFIAALLIWELGLGLARLLPETLTERERLFFSRALLFALLGALGALLAKWALTQLSALNTYITAHQDQSLVQVQQLENTTVSILLFVSIFISLLVIATLLWQMYRDGGQYPSGEGYGVDGGEWANVPVEAPSDEGTAARLDALFHAPARLVTWLRERLDPERQSFLYLLLSTNWVHWFVAFVAGWMTFALLYWVVPGEHCQNAMVCFQTGVGRGIWQGLYYWIQQQQVMRGAQPWYYYLLLLPLYEQLACVFGLAGVVYALMRPTRFRLFLVWWFLGSLGLYSWAGEKMPWLSIHILLPLMLLAAIAVERAVLGCKDIVSRLAANDVAALRTAPWRPAGAVLGTAGALLLLVPMVWGMLVLTQRDAANGPHEMMVYVQTTSDVDLVMNKIANADQRLYGGTHKLRIAVGRGEEWPFWWYLRDYPNAMFDYNAADPKAPPVDVLILLPAGDDQHQDAQTFMAEHPTGYSMKQYPLRAWWDEAYKPPPCISTKGHTCTHADIMVDTGVGLGPYLSYGSTPPPGAKFDPGRAAGRLWNWLWIRKPLGATGGSYDFVFIVRNGVPVKP